MARITRDSTLTEVAAIVSDALHRAGITATLSGGAAVAIYTENKYQSRDLDFVTAAMFDELSAALETLGFVQTSISRLPQFTHPLVEWFVEFSPAPITFGHLYVDHKDCAVIDLKSGQSKLSPRRNLSWTAWLLRSPGMMHKLAIKQFLLPPINLSIGLHSRNGLPTRANRLPNSKGSDRPSSSDC